MARPGASAEVARSRSARRVGSTHHLLREATRHHHLRAERQLAPLLVGAGATAASVRGALCALHGFHAPLEESLRAAAADPPFALIDRTGRLERDLAALGDPAEAIARLPRCRDLPAVRGAADAAGCLYVLEGSQLGGQVIARELERRLGIGPDSGGSFFAGDGATGTAARWRQVLAWIEAVAAAPPEADAVVAAARETFDSLSRWLAGVEGIA